MNTNSIWQVIWDRKLRFLAVFFLIFTVTYAFFYVIDFLPEPPTAGEEEVAVPPTVQSATAVPAVEEVEDIEPVAEPVATTVAAATEQQTEVLPTGQTVLPTSMYIAKLDKTVEVLNPNSRTIEDLDAALLDGVVRHPDSATLDQVGNVFILGHSSYLPNVVNKNFQAFNGIQNLQWGDTIEVTGGDKTYVYRVEKVYKARASEVTVPIANTGNMLTIATCNSFGSTDDRYIVEATQLVVRSS